MALNFLFGNKEIFEPGAYSQIKSEIKNPTLDLDSGGVLIIDTGSASGYAGGGVNGELASGKDAVFSFENINEMQEYVRGGIWWKAAQHLFKPYGSFNGASRVYWVRAATTTAPTITYTLTNGANGGTITIKTVEGAGSNGVLDTATSTELMTGFAGLMRAGVDDPTLFIFEFYVGTYTGQHSDGIEYDELTQAESTPTLIARSPELNNVQELWDWMDESAAFNKYLKRGALTVVGTGEIVTADLTAYNDYELAAGGTTTYAASDLVAALDAVCDLGYSFVLADKYGADAQHANNSAILTHLEEEARFEKFMVVGAGEDVNTFDTAAGSTGTADFYNSEKVIVVHGGHRLNSKKTGVGYREWDVIYKAAFVLGRIAGLPPQTPGTFKAIGINGEKHQLVESERKLALKKGVLHTKYDNDLNAFIINQSINSLQEPANKVFVTTTGKSYEISIMRIVAQLNKEIVVNAKIDLLGNQEQGPNRGILTTEDVRKWVENYLGRKEVRATVDNLITSFRDVTVTVSGDAYFINYRAEPNFPVNKLAFTGFLIDSSVSI